MGSIRPQNLIPHSKEEVLMKDMSLKNPESLTTVFLTLKSVT
jgi:hypothetical protein